MQNKSKYESHYNILLELLPDAPSWVLVILAKQHYDYESEIERLSKENRELKAKYSYGQKK